MNRSESVGSVNSLFAQVRIHPSLSEENLELKGKLAEQEETLADQAEKIQWYRDSNDRLMADAARWNYAKNQYFKQLGYDTPEEVQARVDKDMGRK